MADTNSIQIMATRRIIKYAEGAVPGVDTPYEVTENTYSLTEDEVQAQIARGEIPISEEEYARARAAAQ